MNQDDKFDDSSLENRALLYDNSNIVMRIFNISMEKEIFEEFEFLYSESELFRERVQECIDLLSAIELDTYGKYLAFTNSFIGEISNDFYNTVKIVERLKSPESDEPISSNSNLESSIPNAFERARFEQQKRELEERAARLRRMSHNVKSPDELNKDISEAKDKNSEAQAANLFSKKKAKEK